MAVPFVIYKCHPWKLCNVQDENPVFSVKKTFLHSLSNLINQKKTYFNLLNLCYEHHNLCCMLLLQEDISLSCFMYLEARIAEIYQIFRTLKAGTMEKRSSFVSIITEPYIKMVWSILSNKISDINHRMTFPLAKWLNGRLYCM